MANGDVKDIVRELTATRIKLEETRARLETKLESICKEVKALTDRIQKDHDTILNHEGRITNLEDWKQKHESQHKFFLNLKVTLLIAAVGGAAGAFFGWLFSWLPHP